MCFNRSEDKGANHFIFYKCSVYFTNNVHVDRQYKDRTDKTQPSSGAKDSQ